MRGGIRGGAEEGRRRRGEEDEVKEGAMATRQEIKSSARWSMNMPLAAAVFLFLALPVDPTRAPRHIPKFAFDKDESPVNIPLILKVILVDLGPGAEPPPFRLDKDEFERLLFQTMPEHQPRCAETGEKLHVAFEIFYDVIHASHADSSSLAREVDGEEEAESKAVPVYDVIVEGDVQSELERIYEANSKSAKYDDSLHLHGKGVYSILILNMDKQAIAPDDVAHSRQASAHSLGSSYIYRYKMSHDSASGSDAFLTRSRFVVLDLASGPCLFGSSHSGEGTVTVNSLPRRYDVKWKETEEEKKGMIGSQLQRRSLRFQAELAQVVTSSIQYVFAPDVQVGSRLYALLSLLEHERIAMALNHAMRTDTVHESKHGRYLVRQKNYIDSTLLFRALAESSDYLASGLIAASPVLSQRFFPDFESEEEMHKQQKSRRWALGTRILPVFVFSLEEEWREDVLLFDNWLPYAASKDVVAVIQSGHSDSPVPFFSGSSYITMSLQNPTSKSVYPSTQLN
ncbi:hypothetical protein GUITHDRAFT_116889 [Guillardia theta CCMP2712]|uniref:DUF7906 domain-containing protein n=1 Tax=Guillardia theta (strain CCMP2712) TaxID=905079 RepID=L1IKW0_GUITC|nr:hypothetical protein GUITHDRAFT_116889 [Guillardia theta CCMP2712]EKX36866.1 hypothetical protein GUITHDRAFT_116889 [Guillardia theta CCMP2712]|eukprot:XP_005823846.1 hypothetical protein GUITHDRAFT_116889 [Guillardia theta CCMP2712]